MKQQSDPERKKLAMRSWRRGTKEMDMILGPYADANLAEMSDAELQHYEALLSENDQDLYQWVSGKTAAPTQFNELIADITHHTLNRATE